MKRRGSSLVELMLTLGLMGIMLLVVSQLASGYWRAFHSADRSELYQGSVIAAQIAWEAEQALSIVQPANGATSSVLELTMIDPFDPTRINPSSATAPWNPAGNLVTRTYQVVGEEILRDDGTTVESLGSAKGLSVQRNDPLVVVTVSVQPENAIYPCRARGVLRL